MKLGTTLPYVVFVDMPKNWHEKLKPFKVRNICSKEVKLDNFGPISLKERRFV